MPAFRTMISGAIRLLVALTMLGALSVAPSGLLGSTRAEAQDARIREIRVVGNKRIEPETIRTYLKLNVGDVFDAGRADQSLQALFATGLFADVRVDRSGSALVVTVVENPTVNQVAFEGNREIESSTLAAEVQIKSRSVFTRARVQADVQRILDVYRRQGRFAATVTPKIIELEYNRVNLVFEINEGGATKVKAIGFIGNKAFSDSQLRDVITTAQQGLFDFLKGTSFYDPDRVALDRELLRQYYLKNGYADARIVNAGAELDRDQSGFYVTFVIEEGELYRFGTVNVESSLPSVNPAALRSELQTVQGQIYNASQIDKSAERLTLMISEQGYAFVRVRPRADRDPATRTVNITYVIDEGARIYIERINVNGNTRTQDYVIRREFRVAEGDAYNPLMVDRAKKRLQGLGFFKNVDVKRRPGSSPDRVVLDVDVVEQPTGELSFGAGYSTAEGIIGDISLSERNLFGKGQFVRIKLSGSMERFQIDLSYTEPRFLDRNIAAGFDLFHKDANQSTYSTYRYRRTGGSLRLGFPLSENLWLSTNYTLSRDEIYDVVLSSASGRVASRAIIEAQGESLTSSVGAGITYDGRNHPKSPTRGTFFQLTTDVAGVGGDVQYVRLVGEGRAYYPLTDRITLVGRITGGHIMPWGGEDVRLIDMFYKGGETIRGFARSGYGPRDLRTGEGLGGTTFYAVTAEVRFPIPFVPDELGISGAAFVDAGTLFGAGAEAKRWDGVGTTSAEGVTLADSSSIRVSSGVSLLWNSPLGPLRGDLGWALTRESYDTLQVFRFGASTRF